MNSYFPFLFTSYYYISISIHSLIIFLFINIHCTFSITFLHYLHSLEFQFLYVAYYSLKIIFQSSCLIIMLCNLLLNKALSVLVSVVQDNKYEVNH